MNSEVHQQYQHYNLPSLRSRDGKLDPQQAGLGRFKGWSFLLIEVIPNGRHGARLQEHQWRLEHAVHEIAPHPWRFEHTEL